MSEPARIRKFVEDLGFGRVSSREAYAVDPDLLPVPISGAAWHEVVGFDEAEALAGDNGLARVLDAARRHGVATVDSADPEGAM